MSENNISIFNFEQVEVPKLVERTWGSKKYVNYGTDNRYPEFLWYLYENSSTHQSIIDGLVKYIVGESLVSSDPKIQNWITTSKFQNEFRKMVLDYMIFGGFYLEIIPTKTKELSQLLWNDFLRCRINEDETFVYYSKDLTWQDKSLTSKPIFDDTIENNIFYYKGTKTRSIYPIPLYNAGLKCCMTEIEIQQFHLNNISNGFQSNTIVTFFSGNPKDKEYKDVVERKFKQKFQGTSGAKTAFIWAKNRDEGVQIDKLNIDNFGEQFDQLDKRTKESIFTSHKVTSPALFGVKSENNGFSKEEFEEAYNIFSNTIIRSYQNEIIEELNNIFNLYFSTQNTLSIKPFKIV